MTTPKASNANASGEGAAPVRRSDHLARLRPWGLISVVLASRVTSAELTDSATQVRLDWPTGACPLGDGSDFVSQSPMIRPQIPNFLPSRSREQNVCISRAFVPVRDGMTSRLKIVVPPVRVRASPYGADLEPSRPRPGTSSGPVRVRLAINHV